MPRPESAGTLIYRPAGDTLEVLLVHPSGNYNRRAPWSIPKGLTEPGETKEETARRETREETSVRAGDLVDLGWIDYRKSRKRIFCFGGLWTSGDEPTCASWEVDRAEFVTIEEARRCLHPDQVPFLDRLEDLLGQQQDGQLADD